MVLISLYWFAGQQQTTTLRSGKSDSIYSNFGVKEDKLTPRFQKLQEVAKKFQKEDNTRET